MITSTSPGLSVLVEARDPILKAGVVSPPARLPEVRLLSETDDFPVEVTVVVVDAIDDLALQILKRLQRTTSSRTVLVAGHLDDTEVVAATRSRRRRSAPARRGQRRPAGDHDRLRRARRRHGAAGPARAPSRRGRRAAARRARAAWAHLQRPGHQGDRGAAPHRRRLRHQRDRQPARLSERTVKNVLHDVTTRLQLRNRVARCRLRVAAGPDLRCPIGSHALPVRLSRHGCRRRPGEASSGVLDVAPLRGQPGG